MAGGTSVGATGITDIDGLLGGTKWNSNSINYNFPTSSSYYPAGYTTGSNAPSDFTLGFTAVSASFQAMITKALKEQFAAVTNLTFTLVGSGAASDISVARTSELGRSIGKPFDGYGFYPGSIARAGDIWFAATTADVGDTAILGRGTYFIVMHELGHAMGLKHSHEQGGVANVAMTAAHDFNDYSIMSYRRYENGPTSGNVSETYGRPQSLMMYDILALQTMYGANYTTNSSDTVYSFSSTTGQMFTNGVGGSIPGNGAANSNRIYRTLWDGDGIDTYDFSNYTNAMTIDLTPGGKSILSMAQLAIVNTTAGLTATGNLFNALQYNNDPRSLIENAIGGSANDSITGNATSNTLTGGGGADTMAGGAGNDTYYVDNAGDVVTEQAGQGTDSVFSSINYAMVANVETLYLQEGAATDGLANNGGAGIVGNSNNNNLTGGAGNDTLLGQGGNDRIDGGSGADNMAGGQGDDTFYVDNIADLTSELSGEGNDTAFSSINFVLGANVETLYLVEGSGATDGLAHNAGAGMVGNSNNNNLTGGTGNDTLLGQGGNDRIDGGIGADNMAGGQGHDTFYVDNIADLTSELSGEGNDTAFSTINFVLGANVETLYLVEGSAATDGLAHNAGAGIVGNSNVNNLTGGTGNDTLLGQGGNDRIDGGLGADNMSGGQGDDTFYVDNIADLTSELAGQGTDVAFSTINFVLGANVETLYLVEGSGATDAIGNADRNFLNGNSNHNNINGGGGDDDVLAGGGNDRIQGDAGADNLSGGAGNDSFVFNVIGDAGDTINDFTTVAGPNADTLDLRPLWSTFTGTGGIATVAQAVASGHLAFTQSGGDVLVNADADGAGGSASVLLAIIKAQTAANVQAATLI